MIMRKRSGLSLAEVLSAMALISLLLFFFGSTIAGQYKNLTDSKKMTKEYFAAAQHVETYAQQIRNEWKAAKKVNPLAADITLPPIDPVTPLNVTLENDVMLQFERTSAPDYTVTVKNVYALQADINEYRPLYYYVTDTDIPPLPAPEVEDVRLELSGGKTTGYADESGAKIYSSCTIGGSFASVHENYLWYISKETHLGRKTDDDELKEMAVYPIFPGDYDVLRDKNGKAVTVKDVSLASLDRESLAGRHIMVTVTAAAASGKLGKMAVSENSIYFYGAPEGTDLLLHYDANNLQSGDDKQIRKSGDSLFVKKLYNTQKESSVSHDSHVVNTTAGDQPRMIDAAFGQTQDKLNIRGHALSFADGQYLQSKPVATSGALTIVTVAKSNAPGQSWLTLQDKLLTAQYLQWGDYGLTDNADEPLVPLVPRPSPLADEWVVDVTVISGGNLTYFPGNQDAQANPSTSVITIINEVSVWIGAFDEVASSVDVAEIVVYDKAFSEEDAKKLQAFYQKKYGLID